MRKLGILAALLVVAAIPAFGQSVGPDNYHYNANMNCSDCHSMHASAHDLAGNPITTSEQPFNTFTPAAGSDVINPYYPAAMTPQAKLLKSTDVCASCHDNKTFAPDVIGANSNGYTRSAGGVNLAGGHQIGTYAGTLPPGYSNQLVNYWTDNGTALECYSCHSPHGSANYRNLVPYQMRRTSTAARGGYITDIGPQFNKNAAATWPMTQDVVIGNGNYTFPHTATTFNGYYDRAQITYNRQATPVAWGTVNSSNRMDIFCATCHGNFHGGAVTDTTVGDNTDFVRHPTGIVTIGALPSSPTDPTIATRSAQSFANLKVYQAAATASSTTDSPGCLTCHKAHGNNNPFGLIYPSYSGADTSEQGGGFYKTLCKTCHSMGGVLP